MKVRFGIKNIAETVGVIAIVLSLVFVGLQLQQTHEIAVSEIFSANTGHRIEANIAIVDNSAVWAKASSGDVLTTEELLVIDRLIENLWEARLSLFHHFYELGDEAGADVILTDFAEYLSRNQGIFDIWTKQQLRLSEARTTLSGQENPLRRGVEDIASRVRALAAQDTKSESGLSSTDMAELIDFATRYAAAWSGQDPVAFASFYAENGSLRINDGEASMGREAVEQKARSFMTSFPDMEVQLIGIKQEDSFVEFYWRWTGTNTGSGGTGNSVDLRGHEEWTFDGDGLILESLGHMDDAEYQRQMNATDSPDNL